MRDARMWRVNWPVEGPKGWNRRVEGVRRGGEGVKAVGMNAEDIVMRSNVGKCHFLRYIFGVCA